jgi:hypothetical protein
MGGKRPATEPKGTAMKAATATMNADSPARTMPKQRFRASVR